MRTYTEEYLKRIADELRDINKQLTANNRNIENITRVIELMPILPGVRKDQEGINGVIELKQELRLPDGATVHVPETPDREERFYIIEKGKPREVDISWKKSRLTAYNDKKEEK